MSEMQMRTQEWWRMEYHADPYMRHMDNASLSARFSDVLANSFTVTDDLKLGMLSSAAQGPEGTNYWMICSTHIMEEWAARGSGPPSQIDKPLLPKLDWPGLGSAVLPFQVSTQTHPQVLARYGRAVHLRKAWDAGEIFIKPASSYNDSSLNPAVRDNELELTVYRRSKLYRLLIDRYGRVLSPYGPAYGVKTEVLRAPTDYYVYCVCMLRSLRMFGDFGADSALIIHDIRKFVRRLGEGVRQHLGAGWRWSATPVRYVDPLRAQPDTLDVVECKRFSYTYRRGQGSCARTTGELDR